MDQLLQPRWDSDALWWVQTVWYWERLGQVCVGALHQHQGSTCQPRSQTVRCQECDKICYIAYMYRYLWKSSEWIRPHGWIRKYKRSWQFCETRCILLKAQHNSQVSCKNPTWLLMRPNMEQTPRRKTSPITQYASHKARGSVFSMEHYTTDQERPERQENSQACWSWLRANRHQPKVEIWEPKWRWWTWPLQTKDYSWERITWHYKNISRISVYYNQKPEPTRASVVPRTITPCGCAANTSTVHICHNIARNTNDERNAGVDDAVNIDWDILCYHW